MNKGGAVCAYVTCGLGCAQAADEAQRRGALDALSVAVDGPAWPRPVVAPPAGPATPGVDAADARREPSLASSHSSGSGWGSQPQLQLQQGQRQQQHVRGPEVGAAAELDAQWGGRRAREGGDEGRGAALLAAAAVGLVAPPLDIVARERELLALLGLCGGAEPSGDAAPPGWHAAGDGWGGGGGAPAETAAEATAVAAPLRAWLWREVLLPQPQLLLRPSEELAASAAAAAAWLGAPQPADLRAALFPRAGISSPTAAATVTSRATPLASLGGDAQPGTLPEPVLVASAAEAGDEAAEARLDALRLPSGHATVLATPAAALQAAGGRVWAWLGGGGVASPLELSAALRALPGLLYDAATAGLVGRVLAALLGERQGGGSSTAEAFAGLPAWASALAEATPEAGKDGEAGTEALRGAQGLGGAGRAPVPGLVGAAGPVASAVSRDAAALLLRFPGSLLSPSVLQLLLLRASEQAAAAPPPGHVASPNEPPGELAKAGLHQIDALQPNSALTAAVGRLAGVLHLGRTAAAALLLASGGAAGGQALALTPSVTARVEQVRLYIRAG